MRRPLELPADRFTPLTGSSYSNLFRTGRDQFTPRLWAVEGATGPGALLAQGKLVAAGECVVDVPPKLAAQVRPLDHNHSEKTDTHDARSTAVVASTLAPASSASQSSQASSMDVVLTS